MIERSSGLGPDVSPEYRELVERWEAKAAHAAPRSGKGSGAIDRTISDVPLKPVYGPEDVSHLDLARDLGVPGEFPYTRGIHGTMYRSRLWTMRQFAGFGNAKQTNERYHFLLSQGQMGLSVAFDMPTLMGYDSDSPNARGEVGKCGVAIDSVRDMETLFEGIDLGAITTSMTINGPAAIALAQYIVTAENKGIPRAKLGGTLQADILKEYIAQKEWIFPPRPHVRIIVDMMEFCTREMPKWNTISVSGYHIREAGSTAAQELAFTLADGFAYVEAAMERGMDVDSFAPRLSFFFNSHIDFFEEIAKFRAARRIYARRMRDVYGAKDPRSWQCRFHTQTAGCSATAQQPENNIVRVAFEAMAAALGGTQSLHTNSMDEVLALPTEKSVEIALRTQQVLAYETNVTNVVDPLGGAYFVEALTDEIESRAQWLIDRVDELGGSVQAIDFIKSEIEESAFGYHERYRTGQDVVVGVNKFVTESAEVPDILRVDPESERQQVERLKKFKAERDGELVARRLEQIRERARGPENLLPVLRQALKDRCSIGEVCGAMRDVFGDYRPSS